MTDGLGGEWRTKRHLQKRFGLIPIENHQYEYLSAALGEVLTSRERGEILGENLRDWSRCEVRRATYVGIPTRQRV